MSIIKMIGNVWPEYIGNDKSAILKIVWIEDAKDLSSDFMAVINLTILKFIIFVPISQEYNSKLDDGS